MNTKREAIRHSAQTHEVIKQRVPISCLQSGSFGELGKDGQTDTLYYELVHFILFAVIHKNRQLI
jgi:hypothetical protein